MHYPRRLTGIQAARDRYGARADRIADFFSEGDPLADAAVAALRPLPAARGRELVARAIASGIDSLDPADAPAPLVALFRQVEHVPFWVDRERCNRGGEVFFRCGPFGGIALGFGSLARAYCSSGGNKPLMHTRALIDDAPKRIANTGRFLCAVSSKDGLARGAGGYSETLHVRLLHARIRLALREDADWKPDDWGEPISQADMAVTALLFSHGFAGFVRKLGVHLTDAEEEDLLHLWRHAGYLMGVREELLCATVAEARELAELVDMIDAGPDDDSRRLLQPLLERRPSELRVQSEAARRITQRLFTVVCRDMLGDQYADRIGLDRGVADLGFRHLLRPGIALISRAERRIPGSSVRARKAGQRYWNAVLGSAPDASG